MHVPLHDFKSFRLVLILALTWWERPWREHLWPVSPSRWELACCKEAEICERVTAWAWQGACREESVLVLLRRKLGGEGSPGEESYPRGSLVALVKSSAQAHHPRPRPSPGTSEGLDVKQPPTWSSDCCPIRVVYDRGGQPGLESFLHWPACGPQQVLALTFLLCVRGLSGGFVLEAERLGQGWAHRSFQNVVRSPHPSWTAPGAFRGPCIRSISTFSITRVLVTLGLSQAQAAPEPWSCSLPSCVSASRKWELNHWNWPSDSKDGIKLPFN